MTQISRPFQIALAALVLFIAVWFVALRGHSSGGESSSSAGSGARSSTAATSASGERPASAQSTPGGGSPASQGGVYHGSAPGVEGLSRAIQRARGAVAQSQQNAKRQESAQSSAAQSQGAQTQSASAQRQTGTSQSRASQHPQGQQQAGRQAQQTKPASDVPVMQGVVESELKQGKVVAVLFWNPKGVVDATVRRELRAAAGTLHGKLAVHVARSGAVGSFGSFTHTVQVYSTPTILLVDTNGKTKSVTGLTDAFSIDQSVAELKRAK
jgi:hypothetical protein